MAPSGRWMAIFCPRLRLSAFQVGPKGRRLTLLADFRLCFSSLAHASPLRHFALRGLVHFQCRLICLFPLDDEKE
jgi:hypothetical protein